MGKIPSRRRAQGRNAVSRRHSTSDVAQVFGAVYQGSLIVTQDRGVPGCARVYFVAQPALAQHIVAEAAASFGRLNITRGEYPSA